MERKDDMAIRHITSLLCSAAALSASAAFEMNPSVMDDAYWKVWNDDVQAKIDADIEKYRKADATVEISASDGTEVKVEQISHAFFFGAHIFNFNQLGTSERNARYRELYGTLFNSATVAFYWKTLEAYPYSPRFEVKYEDTEEFWNSCKDPKNQPHWRRPATDSVINFLRARGLRIHGHPLVWGNLSWMTPTWVWDNFCPEKEKLALEMRTGVKVPSFECNGRMGVKSPSYDKKWGEAWKKIFAQLSEREVAEIIPTYVRNYNDLYEKRIRDIAERYGSRIDSWDVVNESATDYHQFQDERVKRDVPCQRSVYGIMPGDYTYKGFQWAGKYLPRNAWLNINDYNMAPYFFKQAKELEAKGCRVDVVGSQMHLFDPKESERIRHGEFNGETSQKVHPDGIAKRFETLSKAGKPIHLSEITITAPDNSPDGQMVQAIIMRNCYRAWFAVEKMNGITWWNVVDDCGAPGEPSISGIFTRDMQPKTAYYAMDDLVNREWKTKTSVKASNGKVAFRGFRGRYRLSWKDANGAGKTKLVEVK